MSNFIRKRMLGHLSSIKAILKEVETSFLKSRDDKNRASATGEISGSVERLIHSVQDDLDAKEGRRPYCPQAHVALCNIRSQDPPE